MITLDRLYQAIDGVAPFALSDAFVRLTGGYDNSGIILRCGEAQSDKVLFALDLSVAAVLRAEQVGAKIIVTHHPAIWKGVERLDGANACVDAVARCMERGISVISAHLNADAAPCGVDEGLAEGLGATEQSILTPLGEGAGYGRTFDVTPCTLRELCERVKSTFQTQNLIVYGESQKQIKRVSSFCGAGADEDAVRQAQGSDVIVSADFSHHVVREALERGMAVVHMTHYASENYGFKKLCKKIEKQIGESAQCEYFTDRRLL